MNGGSQLHTSAWGSALFASATGEGACPLAATIRFRRILLHLLGERCGRYGSVHYDLVIAEPVPGLESQTAAKAITQSINFHPHCASLLMVSYRNLLCYWALDALSSQLTSRSAFMLFPSDLFSRVLCLSHSFCLSRNFAFFT